MAARRATILTEADVRHFATIYEAPNDDEGHTLAFVSAD